MNDYEMMLRMRADRAAAERRWRNHQFRVDAARKEKAQSERLRFDIRHWLARFAGLRSPRQTARCSETPLSAR